jgi:DNA-binding FadR family transcriptional regulator
VRITSERGVGRSTVREALRILQAQGLVSGGDTVSTTKPRVSNEKALGDAVSLAMENALARKTAATEQLRLATEVARIARVRRDAGEGTVLEIIDAETTLVNAQNAVINAEFDFYAAHADLQHAIGADDIDAALRAYEANIALENSKKGAKKTK